MSLKTFSVFYYGHTVTAENYAIDFKEGGSEIQASLNIGDYTLSEYAVEIARAMNAASAKTYTVSVNRTNRKLMIAVDSGTFSLLTTTGSRAGISAFSMMGFSGADKTGASSYLGDTGSGSEYLPQFILQDHIAPENFRKFIQPTVNESASGKVEVVRFGEKRFLECRIMFATDIAQVGQATTLIKDNPTGVLDLRTFLEYATTKARMEFMPNVDARSTFNKVILESTPESNEGTDFKLEEMFGKNMPGYFDTGKLRFREVA